MSFRFCSHWKTDLASGSLALAIGRLKIYPPVYESQVNSVTVLFCRVRRLILGPRTAEIENSDISLTRPHFEVQTSAVL